MQESIEVTQGNVAQERWKPITGFEGLYEVSDVGRVRSVTFRNRHVVKPTMRILRQSALPKGYKRVCLSKDNRKTTVSVHRVVLETFGGECPDGMEAAHGNGMPWDNRLSNLRWATKHDNNVLDKKEHGTYFPSKKTKRMSEIEILKQRCVELEKALVDLATSHNGYSKGLGPCICAAHEEARRVLGMTRDDGHPARSL